ncbi:MAG: NAD(P)-dependent oxidoreductase [Bacteroidales bacterium]|jgi:nucleoside-diphosphate-sugar epimerase|nr:NAD(P)-dependent oxidoreductase [Bacteroidales bacterium]
MSKELVIKNIFITGGSGKVGSAVIPELMKAGYKVRALRFDNEETPEVTEIMDGDLRDKTLAKRALKDMDAVIHLGNCKENRELFLESNVSGTFYLIDEAKNCGHIQQFIQAGSDARAGIYYYPRPFPIDENFPHAGYPGYYPLSKVLEETICEQMRIQYGIPITVLRFSWVHGQDDILAHATLKGPQWGVPIWKEIAETPEQKRFVAEGLDAACRMDHVDGTPGMRHIVGLPDVVQAVMRAIGNKAAIGKAFAIAAPSPFTYDVLSEYISKKLDIPVLRFSVPEFNDFRHDISFARSVLGYAPTYDIFKIVDEAVAFRKAGKKRIDTKYIG